MSVETYAPPVEQDIEPPLEQHEYAPTANEFTMAFAEVCQTAQLVLRQKVPHFASFNHLVGRGMEKDELLLAEKALMGPSTIVVLDKYFAKHADGGILADVELRTYLINMALAVLSGALIDGSLNSRRLPRSRLGELKATMVNAHHQVLNLADSNLGRTMEIGRSHIKAILRAGYGASAEGEHKLSDSAEAGIAVEIATKRYIEELAKERPHAHVRYATSNEDILGRDIVFWEDDKTLLIDTKSSDKAHSDGDQQAGASRLEPLDIGVYKVRDLHPANHRVIGENFEIRAKNYQTAIEQVLQKFDQAIHLE